MNTMPWLRLLVALACCFSLTQKANADSTEDYLKDLAMQFHNASTNGNIDFMSGIVSTAPDALALGTDNGEVLVGHDAIVDWWQGLFSYLGSIGYLNSGLPVKSPQHLQVGYKGDVGWVVDSAVWGFANGNTPFRISLLFKKEQGEWKLLQQHFSIGVPNTQLPL